MNEVIAELFAMTNGWRADIVQMPIPQILFTLTYMMAKDRIAASLEDVDDINVNFPNTF